MLCGLRVGRAGSARRSQQCCKGRVYRLYSFDLAEVLGQSLDNYGLAVRRICSWHAGSLPLRGCRRLRLDGSLLPRKSSSSQSLSASSSYAGERTTDEGRNLDTLRIS
jgi:hypothetical protein